MSYWASRKNLRYYSVALELLRKYRRGNTLLDVGGGPCKYLLEVPEYFRTRVDIKPLPPLPDVLDVVGDFMQFESTYRYHAVLCLQVLEHVEDPVAFTQKLFEAAHLVVISVPFNWPAGKQRDHRHDPIDAAKLHSWTKRQPLESVLVKGRTLDRLVEVYG